MDARLEKAALRARFRAYRLGLGDAEYEALSQAACARILALPEVEAAGTVHVYWPMVERRELDMRGLIRALVESGRRVLLPVVETFEDAPRMRHVLFAQEDTLRPNRWGILEPVCTDPVEAVEPDVVVAPALGAGRDGHRVGQGRGFYDAFLATVAVPTVCAVYAACLVEVVPAEPHDVPVGIVVTERETVRVIPAHPNR